jgi:hypothetical protein
MNDMEQEIIQQAGSPQSKLLHNTGGPRSRTRTEEVRQSMLLRGELTASTEIVCLRIPAEVTDPESWLLETARNEGFQNWEELGSFFILPKEKMLVTDHEGAGAGVTGPMERLRAALILARTNKYRYLPDGPMIFTRSRLERCIRLIEIDLNGFYEME